MVNGAAAHLQLVEPAPEPLSTDAPDATPSAEIGIRIGAAVARAATGICFGLAEYKNGGLTDKTKMANGERIAAVAMLRLDTIGDPGLDFFEVGRVEAAKILRAYLDDDFYRTHGPGAGEATIDGIISSVFTIVGKVVESELAFRIN